MFITCPIPLTSSDSLLQFGGARRRQKDQPFSGSNKPFEKVPNNGTSVSSGAAGVSSESEQVFYQDRQSASLPAASIQASSSAEHWAPLPHLPYHQHPQHYFYMMPPAGAVDFLYSPPFMPLLHQPPSGPGISPVPSFQSLPTGNAAVMPPAVRPDDAFKQVPFMQVQGRPHTLHFPQPGVFYHSGSQPDSSLQLERTPQPEASLKKDSLQNALGLPRAPLHRGSFSRKSKPENEKPEKKKFVNDANRPDALAYQSAFELSGSYLEGAKVLQEFLQSGSLSNWALNVRLKEEFQGQKILGDQAIRAIRSAEFDSQSLRVILKNFSETGDLLETCWKKWPELKILLEMKHLNDGYFQTVSSDPRLSA